MVILYFIAVAALAVFSYGYIDPHLSKLFPYVAYYHRQEATIIFFVLLTILFWCYLYFLKHHPKIWVIAVSALLLVFSYPGLSYDIFNYMTTAKVLYTYRENPYVVMPIEIPNEPYLAFTRAANKVALYGPVWLAISAAPHFLGLGNVWATMFAFKAVNAAAYVLFSWLVYRWTKNWTNVVFFALNPLVLIEVLVNGHNDIYMMILAVAALRYKNIFALIASWFIKGATVPLIFVFKKSFRWTYWVLAAVFFILAPLREELYPWYAVWLIAPAAMLPYKQNKFLWQFTVALSFSLELRYLPYLWMGYYEGPGPMLRVLLTAVPVAVFLGWYAWSRKKRYLF